MIDKRKTKNLVGHARETLELVESFLVFKETADKLFIKLIIRAASLDAGLNNWINPNYYNDV